MQGAAEKGRKGEICLVVLHSDLNNFYATVEKKLFPELAGKPVAVCGDKEARHGVVLAKSEEAKAFGVKTGDVIWEAQRKCPDLIIRPVRFSEYVKQSRAVRGIYARYTDLIEPFGIDECWLDVTHSTIFGSGEEIAAQVPGPHHPPRPLFGICKAVPRGARHLRALHRPHRAVRHR